MLRHCVEVHQNVAPDKIEFRMIILSSHKTAFERQLREAVLIDHFASQYNSCFIPKLDMKIEIGKSLKTPVLRKKRILWRK